MRYFELKTDASVRVEGDIVVEFPKLKEFEHVTIHATRVKSDEHTGLVVIMSGALVA